MCRAKRISHIFVAMALLIVLICQGVVATEIDPRSSLYLSSYGGYLCATSSTTSPGFDIDFDVIARQQSDYVGISKIEIYKANGSSVTTIRGNTDNGLLRANARGHMGHYTYNATVGETYYAVLTAYATANGGADMKTYTTETYTVPATVASH